MRHLAHRDVIEAAQALASIIRLTYPKLTRIWGVPRGGVSAAYLVAAYQAADQDLYVVDKVADADIVIDDLVDSGRTRLRYNDKLFAVLFSKGAVFNCRPFMSAVRVPEDEWLVFPWEGSEQGSADDIVTRLLQFIGEDPQREGLRDTPARVVKAWRHEWASGYDKDPKEVLKVFEDGAESYDEMILVKDIPVYTHCEHHLAPFFGVAHIGYIPDKRIVGLSKLARLTEVFARRLQVQERLTTQIADALMEHLKPKGVAVVLQCRHLCMESRGIQRQGSETTTSKMLGVLFDKPEARAEFFSLIGSKSNA